MSRKSYQTKETKKQKLFDKSSKVAQKILKAFEEGQIPAAPLPTVNLHSKVDMPCREWSYLNRLIVALEGHSDAPELGNSSRITPKNKTHKSFLHRRIQEAVPLLHSLIDSQNKFCSSPIKTKRF